jgi:hypothetical protein
MRMDPPLLLALDEVTQICPIALPYSLADSGGQGVSVWTAFHGRAQLVSRWKESGAQTVMDTSNVRVFMPAKSWLAPSYPLCRMPDQPGGTDDDHQPARRRPDHPRS